jgi:hypothetical protein
MRMRSSLGLALAGAVGVLASCSSQQPTAPQWACGSDAVPYGERVECATDSLVINLDAGTYGCNNGGDYNPNCPPPGAGSDGGTTDYSPDGSTFTGDDGGTTDFGPDGSASGSSSGGCSCGGSSSGISGSSGSGGSSGSTGSSSGNPGHGGPPPGQGGPPPGHGSSSGNASSGSGSSSGGASSGSSSGAGGSSSSGGESSSGSSGSSSGGYSSSGGGDDGGSNGPPWTCVPNPPEVTCSQPPVCQHGAHAAPCGACVPDTTTTDCVPPSEGGCWVTGGGFIMEKASKDTFGGNGMPMRDGSVRGEWENIDHATGDNMHGTVDYLFCRVVPGPGPGHPDGPKHDFVDNQVYFGGPARYFVNAAWADGYWFDIVAEDHGEPGRQDTYQITIRTYANGQAGNIVYQESGPLAGGNIQLHPPNGGHPASQSTLPSWVQLQP